MVVKEQRGEGKGRAGGVGEGIVDEESGEGKSHRE